MWWYVGAEVKHKTFDLSTACKLATVQKFKAAVTSVSPSPERTRKCGLWQVNLEQSGAPVLVGTSQRKKNNNLVEFLDSLCRRANARNVSFQFLYGGQFTLSNPNH